VGLGGAVGSYFSTKFLGNNPSCFTPEASTYSPTYQSSSSSSTTVIICPLGKCRSSSCGEVYSNTAFTLNGGLDIVGVRRTKFEGSKLAGLVAWRAVDEERPRAAQMLRLMVFADWSPCNGYAIPECVLSYGSGAQKDRSV
jgi:hypothetical protein